MEMPDFSKLDLDPNNIGNWPGPLKGVVILILCAALLGAGYWFDTKDQLVTLEASQKKETELKRVFEIKQRKAANLEPLREQLKEMKESFGNLLRLLPNKTEIEGLTIRVTGTYHEFGNFVSSVASLPRIVTQHDINMAPTNKSGTIGESDELVMNMVAKTYRYLEEEEIEAAAASKKKGKRR
jgi:type IV pilus assembly protein PilO